MKTKVLERMKPKAKSFGFTEEELMTVCEGIANRLSSTENVTDEIIDAEIDSTIPVLKLSQSASNRAFEKLKKQFEEDNKKKETEHKETKSEKKEETEQKEEMPKWMLDFKASMEAQLKQTTDELATLRKERKDESFMAKVKEGLKDVDPAYYSMLVDGRSFESEDDVNAFVSKVTEGWEAFCKARNIEAVAKMTPPKGGEDQPEKASAGVLARIEARKKEEADTTPSVLKGLS